MKVLYCTHFYEPEMLAAALRATDNARIWTEDGQDVTVFTGYPNYPLGHIFDGYALKGFEDKIENGVRVLRSRMIIKKNTSTLNRGITSISLLFFGACNMLFRRKHIGTDYDVVLASSGPVFTGLLGWLFSRLIRRPLVMEFRDITYRQMLATGSSPQSFQYKAIRALELWLSRKARRVVCATNGFKEVLMRDGIDPDKIFVVTNGVDVEGSGRRSTPSQDAMTLSYFGTLGISQQIEQTIEYAQALRQALPCAEYLIVGDGAQADVVKAAAGHLPFVRVIPGMSPEKLEPYYEKTHLAIVKLRKASEFRDTLPSKLFQVMGRGIPVLFIGPPGEAADIVVKYGAGITLTGTREEDHTKLIAFFKQPDWAEKLDEMSRNGVMAVKEHYSRRELAREYLGILRGCLDDHTAGYFNTENL